jgi:2-polyprenyl-6-methoxyphenol hydroxylase-like FAD-dependent oxidoreductase
VLLIGDAAHAMSPIGGVGINLAVQDAVAAARIVVPGIISRTLSTRILAKVQSRRAFPTVVTQALQLGIQRLFLERVLAAEEPVRAPRALRRLPAAFQKLPALLIGVGVRPEHLRRRRSAGPRRTTIERGRPSACSRDDHRFSPSRVVRRHRRA